MTGNCNYKYFGARFWFIWDVVLNNSKLLNEEQNPTRCHLLLYYAYVRFNMFRAPLCPSSVVHDDSVGYHIGCLVLELLLVGG
jgi:hypothetical protein